MGSSIKKPTKGKSSSASRSASGRSPAGKPPAGEPPAGEPPAGKSPTSRKAKKRALQDYATWFEIPALDINRAAAFYNTIFDIEMVVTYANEFVMALFPASKGLGGALVVGPGCVPSSVGTLIYLNGGPDLNDILSRIDGAGGRIVLSKTLISEQIGHFALFIDTEGNRLALHSKS